MFVYSWSLLCDALTGYLNSLDFVYVSPFSISTKLFHMSPTLIQLHVLPLSPDHFLPHTYVFVYSCIRVSRLTWRTLRLLQASSPACTELETIVMDWLGKMLGLPGEFLHSNKTTMGGGVIQVCHSIFEQVIYWPLICHLVLGRDIYIYIYILLIWCYYHVI